LALKFVLLSQNIFITVWSDPES